MVRQRVGSSGHGWEIGFRKTIKKNKETDVLVNDEHRSV